MLWLLTTWLIEGVISEIRGVLLDLLHIIPVCDQSVCRISLSYYQLHLSYHHLETTTTSGSQPLSFPPFFTSSPGQRSPLNSTTDSVDFTPIVSLPEVFNIQSGEEEEEVLFSHRAKLYRFDESIKQWKERGLGDIKILEHKRTRKCRVLMRRERIFKICCNHTITPYMQLKPFGANNESWLWFTPCDYSDLVAKPEKLVIKFKLVETAQNFQRVFNRCTSGSSQQEEGKEMDNEKEEPVTE